MESTLPSFGIHAKDSDRPTGSPFCRLSCKLTNNTNLNSLRAQIAALSFVLSCLYPNFFSSSTHSPAASAAAALDLAAAVEDKIARRQHTVQEPILDSKNNQYHYVKQGCMEKMTKMADVIGESHDHDSDKCSKRCVDTSSDPACRPIVTNKLDNCWSALSTKAETGDSGGRKEKGELRTEPSRAERKVSPLPSNMSSLSYIHNTNYCTFSQATATQYTAAHHSSS